MAAGNVIAASRASINNGMWYETVLEPKVGRT